MAEALAAEAPRRRVARPGRGCQGRPRRARPPRPALGGGGRRSRCARRGGTGPSRRAVCAVSTRRVEEEHRQLDLRHGGQPRRRPVRPRPAALLPAAEGRHSPAAGAVGRASSTTCPKGLTRAHQAGAVRRGPRRARLLPRAHPGRARRAGPRARRRPPGGRPPHRRQGAGHRRAVRGRPRGAGAPQAPQADPSRTRRARRPARQAADAGQEAPGPLQARTARPETQGGEASGRAPPGSAGPPTRREPTGRHRSSPRGSRGQTGRRTRSRRNSCRSRPSSETAGHQAPTRTARLRPGRGLRAGRPGGDHLAVGRRCRTRCSTRPQESAADLLGAPQVAVAVADHRHLPWPDRPSTSSMGPSDLWAQPKASAHMSDLGLPAESAESLRPPSRGACSKAPPTGAAPPAGRRHPGTAATTSVS